MANFYTVVFLVGVFYTFISLIISGVTGAVHSHGDFGGANMDGHLGHHGHIDGGHVHADTGHSVHAGHTADGSHISNVDGQHGHAGEGSGVSHSVMSWFTIILNPLVAVSFLTVFGGMGVIGVNYFKWDDAIVLLVALAAGVVVSTLLYNFVAKPIYRSENSSDVSRDELIGTAAEVTTDIIANGFGTIKYTVNSIMFTAPSKHIDEKAVMQGEKVVICKIEDNIFYISELSSVLK